LDRFLLTALRDWKNRPARKPLLLDGARQTGKTYLLQALLGREFPRVLRLDFLENPGLAEAFAGSLDPQDVLTEIALLTGVEFNPATDLLILDEIGECARAVTALKYFAEKMPQAFVAASGSNMGLLGAFPVGKVEQHIVRPLTFREFLWASGDALLVKAFEARTRSAAAHARLFDQLTDYYFTGGMPEAVAAWYAQEPLGILKRVEAVSRVHADLVAGYRRDFGKYAGKADAQLIAAVFDSIPAQLYAVHDESVRRFQFRGVHARKARYADFETAISWLHKSRLALKNLPVEGQPASPLAALVKESRVKLFFFDVGLLNHMLGSAYREIKQQAAAYKGYVAENFVQQELAALGCEPSYSWQDARAEIEFIVTDDNGRVIPVEVKSGKRTRAKSLLSYIAKCAPHMSVKLTGTQGSGPEEAVNVVLPLYYVEFIATWLGGTGNAPDAREVWMGVAGVRSCANHGSCSAINKLDKRVL